MIGYIQVICTIETEREFIFPALAYKDKAIEYINEFFEMVRM